MRRGAVCRFGAFAACTALAVRSVDRKPYCERHAVVMERIRHNVRKHKRLLERLAGS